MRKIIFIIIVMLTISQSRALAQSMSSENYQIQGGDFNIGGGQSTSENFKLSDSIGQSAALEFTAKGYIVRSGFQNSQALSSLTFSVSPNSIDFGPLLWQKPQEKSLILSVANGNSTGYIVKVAQNRNLTSLNEAEIPDTLCSTDKKNFCKQDKADAWTSGESYGFGYRMEGKNVPEDFYGDFNFRPFPAIAKKEPYQIILESNLTKVNDTAKMILKINISQSQPVGVYRNILSFTALPGL